MVKAMEVGRNMGREEGGEEGEGPKLRDDEMAQSMDCSWRKH